MRLTLLFALGAALAATPAAAQTAPAAAAEAAPAASFSDAQLRGYAGAWIELARIQEELNPRIQAATGDARTALERQAAERMGASVTQHGLDPETFNRISTAMRTDAALSQQINGFVQEVAAAAQAQGAAQGTGSDN